MKRGFTLIELMVASVLLGMLVIVLTMIFNQSSIAWRTGVAGVAELGKTRNILGTFREVSDDILPGLGGANSMDKRTVSLWDGESLRIGKRAFDSVKWGNASSLSYDDAQNGTSKDVDGTGKGQSASLFTVGVRSAGPDRAFGTEDDITSWPEDVD